MSDGESSACAATAPSWRCSSPARRCACSRRSPCIRGSGSRTPTATSARRGPAPWPYSPAAAAGAGLALGYAAVVRSVALPLVAVFVAYLAVRRVGLRPLAAFLAGWVVVIGAYAVLFDVQHGHLGFTRYGGRFLYAQVAP